MNCEKEERERIYLEVLSKPERETFTHPVGHMRRA